MAIHNAQDGREKWERQGIIDQDKPWCLVHEDVPSGDLRVPLFPQSDCSKPSIDGAAPSKWQRITAANPPQFPCWLWNNNGFMRKDGIPGPYHPKEFEFCRAIYHSSHWHPDQPDAPTSGPKGNQSEQSGNTPSVPPEHNCKPLSAQRASGNLPTPQPEPTPRTDAQETTEKMPEATAYYEMVEHARALEIELAERTRERDEARRERDAWKRAVFEADKTKWELRKVIGYWQSQWNAQTQDRDGLAALVEELRKQLTELLRMYCLVQRCELNHPCPESISTLADKYAALALTPAEALRRKKEERT